MSNNNALKPRVTRGWPPERRRAQAERLKRLKIWTRSTGPRTENGKAICARNALKSGSYTRDMQDMRRALACVRVFIKRAQHVIARRHTHGAAPYSPRHLCKAALE